MPNGKWKREREKTNKKIVSCLGFNPKSYCTHTPTHTWQEDYVVGIFITKSGLNAPSRADCGTILQAHCFPLPKTPDAFWHCFLLFFMIICIHQFCIDSPTTMLPPSLHGPRRKDKYRHTHTHTSICILCPYIEVGRRQWILMSWLDSASCFANSQTASYEFMSYKNSCWAAAPVHSTRKWNNV